MRHLAIRRELPLEPLDLLAQGKCARAQKPHERPVQLVLDRRVLALECHEAHRALALVDSYCARFHDLPLLLILPGDLSHVRDQRGMGQRDHRTFINVNAQGPHKHRGVIVTTPNGGYTMRSENGVKDRGGVIRVLVVDDYDLFRTGLASLLAGEPDIEVVGQASGGRAGARLALELQPDVVLMDLRMPDMSGHEATRVISAERPEIRVVVLTALAEDDDVEVAVQAGACGFLAKDTPIDDVLSAVRAAATGAAWLSPRAAEVVLGHLRRTAGDFSQAQDPVEELSPRELEVLHLIARGMENAEIAASLSISPRTAKNHVSSILAKLGLPSRVQAAIYAVRHGLD
jgi:DNA-binding NarL/FixJ family response regulator